MSQGQLDSRDQLTRSSLIDLLRCDAKNRQYLNHDLHYNVRHCHSGSYFRVGLQPPEKILDTLKEIDEHVLTSIDILGYLIADMIGVTISRNSMMSMATHLEKNTNANKDHFCRRENLRKR